MAGSLPQSDGCAIEGSSGEATEGGEAMKSCPFMVIIAKQLAGSKDGVALIREKQPDVGALCACAGESCAIYDGSRKCCGMIARGCVETIPVDVCRNR